MIAVREIWYLSESQGKNKGILLFQMSRNHDWYNIVVMGWTNWDSFLYLCGNKNYWFSLTDNKVYFFVIFIEIFILLYHLGLKLVMLEKEAELSRTKIELADLEEYQVRLMYRDMT